MSFDTEPDGDPHGECTAEIHRLESLVAQLLAALIEARNGLSCYEEYMSNIIGASQHCDCASFGLAQECRNQWTGAAPTLLLISEVIDNATRKDGK